MRLPVEIDFYESGKVVIRGESLELKTTVDELTIAARLGNTRRSLFLPGGAKLETEDNAAVDQVCTYFARNRWQSLLHSLEQHWLYVVVAFAVSVIFLWGGIEFGVPAAAKWVARGVPLAVEKEIGEQGLATLEEWLFTQSKIDGFRQKELQAHFQHITADLPHYNYRLQIRSSEKMGANALALPGGIIVMTDGLVELAENDDQILAVLAHEIGHVEKQHGLRSVLQDSLTALFMAGLLGDITSVSSLSVTLPTILVESRYSREFETEADRFAVAFLRSKSIAETEFIRILTLLEQSHNMAVEFDYLSSHPAMHKRIAMIESLQKLRQ